MVHWGFLILAFIAGAGICYGVLYWAGKAMARIEATIDEAAESCAGRG